jgi:hypothetical protein
MPQVRPILTNFTAGEWSPKLYGRVDLSKYGNSARKLLNCIVRPQGGARKRGGTRHIHGIKDNDANARIVPFIFSTEQRYLLEFGAGYIRFIADQGVVVDAQVPIKNIRRQTNATVRALSHGFSNGDRVIITGVSGMTEVNNREFTVSNAATHTFRIGINTTGYEVFKDGGFVSRIYEIATVYGADDIADLQFVQNADTLFIFHPDWPIAKLVRNGHTDWVHSWVTFDEGPFLDLNTTDTTLSLSASTGTAILTASDSLFESAHIGSIWRIWDSAGRSATFGYAAWVPGGNINADVDRLYEHDGNVYRVIAGYDDSGASATLPSEIKSVAVFPTHTEGTARVYIGGSGGGAATHVDLRYEHSGYCLVRIDSLSDDQNANVTILGKYRVPYTALGARSSKHWQQGAWSDKWGYPRTGAFHEQRFCAASTASQPSTVWASRTGIFNNFQDGAENDRAITYTIGGNQVDAILFLVPGKVLTILTTSSEYTLKASRSEEAATPTNIRIAKELSYGSAERVFPMRLGPVVLFGQRSGDSSKPARRIREMVYNIQTDSYLAPELTILSDHLTVGGVLRGAYQLSPDAIVWYQRTDGALIGMTYEREQSVVGWHQHVITDGLVQDLATLPGPYGDEVYAIVGRGSNRVIELLTDGLRDDQGIEDATYLDAHLTYDGEKTRTIGGLWHLNNKKVAVLADGVPYKPAADDPDPDFLLVRNGKVTLPVEAGKVHVGLTYTSRIETQSIEAGAVQGSTAQGRVGRVIDVTLRLYRSIGGRVGPSDDAMAPIQYRDPSLPLGTALDLFTGDKLVGLEGRWDRDRPIIIEHDDPLPMEVCAVMPFIHVN